MFQQELKIADSQKAEREQKSEGEGERESEKPKEKEKEPPSKDKQAESRDWKRNGMLKASRWTLKANKRRQMKGGWIGWTLNLPSFWTGMPLTLATMAGRVTMSEHGKFIYNLG